MYVTYTFQVSSLPAVVSHSDAVCRASVPLLPNTVGCPTLSTFCKLCGSEARVSATRQLCWASVNLHSYTVTNNCVHTHTAHCCNPWNDVTRRFRDDPAGFRRLRSHAAVGQLQEKWVDKLPYSVVKLGTFSYRQSCSWFVFSPQVNVQTSRGSAGEGVHRHFMPGLPFFKCVQFTLRLWTLHVKQKISQLPIFKLFKRNDSWLNKKSHQEHMVKK